MTNFNLGRLVRVDSRVVWQQEAGQFTPWLADNIRFLNEALGLEIEFVQREKPVGDFAVDIFGRETGANGREVIIENQLDPTNHNHLGQLLTYAAGLDAKIVVWISPQFRDEHRQALDWLNLHTTKGVDFFGVELELFRIDDSLPAPHFKVVAQPNEWQEEVASQTQTVPTERRIAYHDFFVDLLNRLKDRSPNFTSSSRVGYENWMSFGAGRSGFSFGPVFATNRFQVELYIDTGSKEVNEHAFDLLCQEREVIEGLLGETLVWERLDNRRACRVSAVREGIKIDSLPLVLATSRAGQ